MTIRTAVALAVTALTLGVPLAAGAPDGYQPRLETGKQLAPAAAPARGPISLSGTQTIVSEQRGEYALHGSLVGTWKITEFVPTYQSSAQLVGTGKERFAGCLDENRSGSCEPTEPTGSMRFTFTTWMTFDPQKKTLVRGACVHPIAGGTRDFAGARGVIFMKDTPAKNGVRTTYTGTLELGPAAPAPALQARRSGCGVRA